MWHKVTNLIVTSNRINEKWSIGNIGKKVVTLYSVMKRTVIDRETRQRIIDTADIVDVVSDFVTLKRRGANYIGLCPFHNERTPSFSVSRAKGYCKCFSCGKGGSPVGFLMEHEQMSFTEALRYLAKKYNIEIKEHELTDKEREEASARETLFAVNDFALHHFAENLKKTDEGRDVGLAYFKERGINEQSIERFKLGFAVDNPTDLYDAEIKQGFEEKYIIESGLCIKNEQGRIYDRFRGRVIYPVHTVSGKVVAFGGRTLRTDKKMAKYVNSPESSIYSKSREVYGLYQAKSSIARKNKCILVEGYMDVISMSQNGVENVVASSGTSLTEGQIRLIHRFTENVTLIYDSDPAGIKASLRGTDMLLTEGLNIKIVLLPDGDDPDSFAQSHSATEVEEYIEKNETDFIRFKTRILLEGAENDPIKRSGVITDIVRSISVIPNDITRSVYIKECSRLLDADEKMLAKQVGKYIRERVEKEAENRARQKAGESIQSLTEEVVTKPEDNNTTILENQPIANERQKLLRPHEYELVKYIIKYGMIDLPLLDEQGNTINIKVIDYVDDELKYDKITITDPVLAKVYEICMKLKENEWETDFAAFNEQALNERATQWDEGLERIKNNASTMEQINVMEKQLKEDCDADFFKKLDEHARIFFVKRLISSSDDNVRKMATELASSRYMLSKVHSKYVKVETEQDRLQELLPRAIYGLKDAMIQDDLRQLRQQLRAASEDTPEAVIALMNNIAELDNLRRQYAKYLGERVIMPR